MTLFLQPCTGFYKSGHKAFLKMFLLFFLLWPLQQLIVGRVRMGDGAHPIKDRVLGNEAQQ